MANTKHKAIQKETAISNWALAENADNVLHSRIQSYLIAQTFLVTAYATLLTVGGESGVVLLARTMACLVATLGFAISWFTRRRMQSILSKLSYLMKHKLAQDANFQDYVTQGGTIEASYATRNEFVYHIPIIIQTFWVIALILTVVLSVNDLAGPTLRPDPS